ncbi:unnamed protein product [marine sediment metagenome]|uniref:Uncharacterized protein n=1 Tax=marine sediment metagenome TaxID=412755 RepID=X1BMA8_9ZZZZ
MKKLRASRIKACDISTKHLKTEHATLKDVSAKCIEAEKIIVPMNGLIWKDVIHQPVQPSDDDATVQSRDIGTDGSTACVDYMIPITTPSLGVGEFLVTESADPVPLVVVEGQTVAELLEELEEECDLEILSEKPRTLHKKNVVNEQNQVIEK